MPAAPAAAQRIHEDRAIYQAMTLLEDRLRKPGERMGSPQDVRNFLALLLGREQREVFTALWLDTQTRLIAAEHLFFGSIRETYVHPREVLRRGLQMNAASVIFAHNHPSGNAEPSRHDLELTARLIELLELVDIRTLDHFIVAGSKTLSLAEQGLLGRTDFPQPPVAPPRKTRARKASAIQPRNRDTKRKR